MGHKTLRPKRGSGRFWAAAGVPAREPSGHPGLLAGTSGVRIECRSSDFPARSGNCQANTLSVQSLVRSNDQLFLGEKCERSRDHRFRSIFLHEMTCSDNFPELTPWNHAGELPTPVNWNPLIFSPPKQ